MATGERGLLLYAPVWRVRYFWSTDNGDDDGENTEYVVAKSAEDACAFVTGQTKNSAVQSVDRLLTVEITNAVISMLVDARRAKVQP